MMKIHPVRLINHYLFKWEIFVKYCWLLIYGRDMDLLLIILFNWMGKLFNIHDWIAMLYSLYCLCFILLINTILLPHLTCLCIFSYRISLSRIHSVFIMKFYWFILFCIHLRSYKKSISSCYQILWNNNH